MQELAILGQTTPRLGLLINSIGSFNPAAKDRSEQAIRDYFASLSASGTIDRNSIIRGRIFGPHEAAAAANDFAEARVDLVVIANVAFPNGLVFLTLATNPYLWKIPIAVMGEPEPEGNEWATNAWCGVIMNNFVAKRISRPIETISGLVGSPEFTQQFDRLLRVARTIKLLRSDVICRFGDAPGGFHSATGDQLAFAATFGTIVDTVDLTAVMETYRSGTASGLKGSVSFTDEDVAKTVEQITANRRVTVGREMVERGARLYHAYRAIIRANGYTSATFRCWPEFQSDLIPMASCLAQGLLMANGDVTAAACEGDWPTAVAQTMGTSLTGKPAPCLDFVNYTGGSETVQLGHCGVGMCGYMATDGGRGVCDEIALHPVGRQAGHEVGPVHIGQFEYGEKTGICLTQDRSGRFKLLAFSGESSTDTARGQLYSATDVRVPEYRELNRLILEHGFPHHLAVALGDVTEDLRVLCRYLDVDFYSPNRES